MAKNSDERLKMGTNNLTITNMYLISIKHLALNSVSILF